MATTHHTLSTRAVEALGTDGFVVLPGPFPTSQIASLQAAYDSACATAAPEDIGVGRTSTRVNDFVNRGPAFEPLFTWPPALEAARLVIGARYRLSVLHARTLHRGAQAQQLHVDVPRASDAWPMFGFIFMVDDFRADNGATRFVPGSHRRLDPPERLLADLFAPQAGEVLACGPAGSVILFDTSTWHGHTANSSAAPRRSLQGTFIPYTARPATDFVGRLQPETRARLGSTARDLIGLGPSIVSPPV